MAELTISADDIQGAIEEYVSSFTSDTAREEVGTVIDTGDGIAHVEGLPSVMTQELLEFSGGVLGVALNLDEHSVGAVILGDSEKLAQRPASQAHRRGALGARRRRLPRPGHQSRSGTRSTARATSKPRHSGPWRFRPRRWCSGKA